MDCVLGGINELMLHFLGVITVLWLSRTMSLLGDSY